MSTHAVLCIDGQARSFSIRSMAVETLGQAWNASWTIGIRCLDDGREGLKHTRRCHYRGSLDMETLVCTRGRDFPLARLAQRLRCPRCGCREMAVAFVAPGSATAVRLSRGAT